MQTRSSPNRDTLVRLAQRMGIPDADKLAKADLFTKLHDQFNFERLLRTELRRTKADSKSSKRTRVEDEEEIPVTVVPSEKKARLNRLDPIMFVPVVKRKAFKFSRPNGTVVQFNVDSLIEYLLSSGDFHDPETRLPFSDQDLHDIDKIGKDIGLTMASVYDAKRNVNGYSEAKFRRDALLALERCAGEVVADMLDIAENNDPDDAQMQLVMREFPVFLDFYRQLKQADPPYAHKCLAHWRIFITGPPNRPNIDDYGLLRIVSNFLRSCEDA